MRDRIYVALEATSFSTHCRTCTRLASERGYLEQREIDASEIRGELPRDKGIAVVRCPDGHQIEVVRVGGPEFRRRARNGRFRLDNGNTHIQLSILGYAYPAAIDNVWDANWLRVKLDASRTGRAWSTVENALTTFEAAHLADWLDGDPTRWGQDPLIEFMQLYVALERRADGVLRVYLDDAFRPVWASWPDVEQREFFLDLMVSEGDLHSAAAAVRAELLRFPARLADEDAHSY